MKTAPITTTKYAKRRNCIWRAARNPFSFTVVGKFVKDGDEDGSPTIQETRVENQSLGEGSIHRAMERNKARRLKEKGKAKDDYAAQHEVAASLQLMTEQNVFVVEERNSRHKERAKQMDDRNMQRDALDYTPMSKAYFVRKKREIMTRR
ncbi:hypothetical protein D8674_026827 [Pyrus ussuriensis x Pyrus communis]|uniref:No apical meristem-associated C-terminal domain-containing protein n=1 Tax=Pyrus ussuriensis x Pyrus communis TaxID=2448454 RepID=A0A5N5IB03_9ROSA|nr:hypothetical protein D8674_026827 [Pyrus ussuriensis x Pyrus communis]